MEASKQKFEWLAGAHLDHLAAYPSSLLLAFNRRRSDASLEAFHLSTNGSLRVGRTCAFGDDSTAEALATLYPLIGATITDARGPEGGIYELVLDGGVVIQVADLEAYGDYTLLVGVYDNGVLRETALFA